MAYRSACPIASALDLVGDRWSLLILRSMVIGATSYSEFQAAPERISTNILADRLRCLEQAGLITRTRVRQGTTPGAYGLTEKGAGLIPTLQALAQWGEKNIPDRWKAPRQFYTAKPEDFRPGDTTKRRRIAR